MTTQLLQLEQLKRIADTMGRIEVSLQAEAERRKAFLRLGARMELGGFEGSDLLVKVRDLNAEATLLRAEAAAGLRSAEALAAKFLTGTGCADAQPVPREAPAESSDGPQHPSSFRQFFSEAPPFPTSSSSDPQADLGKKVG